jgi:hypothetical protein
MSSVITSITGLQNLSNLSELRADFNALTSIDLSGMSSLTIVDVSDQDSIVDGSNCLTSINLSGCTSLGELRLDDSNFSAGLPDLSDCTSLTFVDFDQCGLVGSVDISNLPALEFIDFNGNLGLTQLIISSSQPLGDNGNEVILDSCAFSQTEVDNILLTLASSSVNSGYVNLNANSGTNSAPGAAGREALFVLDSKGWNFNVETGNHTMLTLAYEVTESLVCASTNTNTYYIVSGSSLTIGNKLYTNSDAWNPAINGWYATGSLKFQVSGSGTIVTTGSCV